MHSLVVVAAAALIGLASTSPIEPRQQVCNGRSEYCNRKYSEISYVGAHDSAFVGSTIDPRVDQEESLTQQLDAGIRFVEVQFHKSKNDPNVMELCHTSCDLLDAGPLQNYLSTLKTWLDGHPNEVVTLMFANNDDVQMTILDGEFAASGLKNYGFIPKTSPNTMPIDQWPTLSEIIASGKRLITFVDYVANEQEVPYILAEYNYMFSTPYDTTDPNFPECTLDIPKGADPTGRMTVMNHFLDVSIFGIDIPDNAEDYQTNAVSGNGSITAQADICNSMYGHQPQFVLVDMFDRGDVLAASWRLNGLADPS
ncbi:pi-plc x domain-containing protein 1 [Acrodontium crateriforme]|uniref:Pi-plc x domain-containing protein 1 n=1 Tax=Acrodontium crateriforme TaxID=150365 RepID=A0AAQ3M0Y2_9PEZI|nr:pi-plc x domain-containing protein 1 [Acrodontium crateriforme]